MGKYIFIFTIILLSLLACTPSGKHSLPTQFPEETIQLRVEFAKGFEFYQSENLKFIVVKNPWQGAENIQIVYCLYPKNQSEPFLNFPAKKIPIPIESVACMSSTHVGFLEALQQCDKIQGVSGIKYLHNETILESYTNNNIREIGSEGGLNWEVLIEIAPDLLFNFGIGNEVSASAAKLEELKINDFLVAEYLETSPLGKAEWIKCFAAFFGKDSLGQQIFDRIKTSYLELKTETDNISYRPRILTGMPWKEVWYLPGNESYLANFIQDAGGEYVWSHWKKREPQALSLETVFMRASDADIWINAGFALSLNEITEFDNRLGEFKAFQAGQVYNNNLRQNKSGGNDYWESGIMEPHIILRELIAIFHPEDKSDQEFKYYQKLDSLKL